MLPNINNDYYCKHLEFILGVKSWVIIIEKL